MKNITIKSLEMRNNIVEIEKSYMKLLQYWEITFSNYNKEIMFLSII